MTISRYPVPGTIYVYELITSSSVWAKPNNVNRVDVFIAGGGGGGGGGARQSSTATQTNGGAGGGSGLFQAVYGIDISAASTVAVTVGAGGVGGAGGVSNPSSGSAGADAGRSFFGIYAGTRSGSEYLGKGGGGGPTAGTSGGATANATSGVSAGFGTFASTGSINTPIEDGASADFSIAFGPNSVVLNQGARGGGGASYDSAGIGFNTGTFTSMPFPFFPTSLVTSFIGNPGIAGTGTSPGSAGSASRKGMLGGGGFGGFVNTSNNAASGSESGAAAGGGGGGGRDNGGNGGNAAANSGSGGGGGGGGRNLGGTGGNGGNGFVIIGYYKDNQ